ncbi:hypothetical protein FQ142_13105 [Microbacterium sp. ANT_H45B]|uniref:hypothetical protein n=1 Tax=Microbacterium sp. ANT_H45B TaxID=2597346 RepID=UPI0011EC351F|nr:hypothetical protein [Microbacterium sp. ANT_H45B]KAA0959804.1 hypothetical protein FQ142_13105 [Microbacterium sp. ANT_H45B]
MLGAEEAVELRALQERAYGREGALGADEVARLRRLEALRRAPSPSHTESEQPAAQGAAAPDAPSSVFVDPAGESAPAPAPDSQDTGAEGSAPSPRRTHHGRSALLLAAVCIVLGVGAGWLLFADRGASSMSLTSTQQEWQNAIVASGRYDPGSVRALRQEQDVVVWYATKGDGAQVCVVLGDAESTAPACTTREQALAQGVSASLVTVVDDSQTLDVDAYMYLTDEGAPAIVTSSYISMPQSSAQFANPEEAAVAVSLAEDVGLDRRSIMVVGYDGETPIWVGVDKATQRYCLVVDGSSPSPPMVCDDSLMLADADRSLGLVVDDGDGSTRYEYRFGYGQGYLTVTRDGEGDDAA